MSTSSGDLRTFGDWLRGAAGGALTVEVVERTAEGRTWHEVRVTSVLEDYHGEVGIILDGTIAGDGEAT